MKSRGTTGGQVKAQEMTGVNRESLLNDRCGQMKAKSMTGVDR